MKQRVILLSLLLCLAQPFAAKKQNTPDEISSAHTVAVVAHAVKGGGGRYLEISNPSLEAQLSAEAQELSREGARPLGHRRPRSSGSRTPLTVGGLENALWGRPRSDLSGGAHSDPASRVPLWVGEGQSGFSAADYFLAESSHQQKAALGLHFIVPGRMARLRSRSDGAAAAGPQTVRPGIPDELLRAKSAAVFGYSPENPWGIQLSHPFLKGSLAASLEKWGRFRIVDNSQDADLIFVIYIDEHRDVDIHSRSSENYTREALIIFANARTSDFPPMPLWMEQVDEKEVWGVSVKLDMIYVLRKDIERAETTKH